MKKYLVGGAVRDQLLNFPFSEKDWVVVGSTPEQMIKQGFRPVGKDFPVFLHPETGEEYALARTERKTAPGYKGFTFHTDTSVSLEEDLERRDLTINAIAQDENGDIIDPYDGQEDIERRKLRHVSLAFAEDPVRILRVARFSARYHHLGFTVVPETLDLMSAMVIQGETKHLVPERVWQELVKALSEQSPQQFFLILSLCGALKDILPELNDSHYKTSMLLLATMCAETDNATLRFAAICQTLALEEIQVLCRRLGSPNDYRDMALLLKRYGDALFKLMKNDLHLDKEKQAEAMAVLLQSADAMRKPERFHTLCIGSASLPGKKDKQAMILFWQKALEYYQAVDPQALIKQGYKKSELGHAIFQERIKQLFLFLSSNELI